MSEFANTVRSPVWWAGVVVVGFVLNLAAAYLKPYLDDRVSRLSRRWSGRNAREKAKRTALVHKLRADPQEQLLASHRATRRLIRTAGHLVMGGIGFVMVHTTTVETLPQSLAWLSLLVASMVIILGSVRMIQEAEELTGAVKEARGEM